MKDFYINSVLKMKKNHIKEYLQTLTDIFGEVITIEELREKSEDVQIEVMKKLKRKVKIADSVIDVKALARAIQEPRSLMAGQAFTKYTCKHCGKVETWKNTAVPKMCYQCAEEIAQEIAYSHQYIVKVSENDKFQF